MCISRDAPALARRAAPPRAMITLPRPPPCSCRADREHAEVGVVAAVFELAAGDDRALPLDRQQPAVGRLDDREHALRVGPLPLEDVRLGGPPGPAGVPAVGRLDRARPGRRRRRRWRRGRSGRWRRSPWGVLRNLWHGWGTDERNAAPIGSGCMVHVLSSRTLAAAHRSRALTRLLRRAAGPRRLPRVRHGAGARHRLLPRRRLPGGLRPLGDPALARACGCGCRSPDVRPRTRSCGPRGSRSCGRR